ncbi:hypothetical protein RRG08_063287 [Elysia crispata]|uniref:HTH psq-type domain-containing protein n=1 Tax=Elysia crispata TaxID=231223 RepID=A0AAE0XP39_9GAST|nr:hypothetical protein RRG08_063287 [Elysia crispata]
MERTSKYLYGKYSEEQLKNALDALRDRGLLYSKASKDFGVPKSTIKDHFNGQSVQGKKAGRACSIPEDIENNSVDKFIAATAAGLPLTKRQVLVKLGILVKNLGLKTQFKNGVPGDNCWRALKSRGPDLVIRKFESCPTNCMRRVNYAVVD